MRRFISLISVSFLLCSATAAVASSGVDERFYIAPMASYGFFNEDVTDPDDEVGAQIAIGKNLDRFFALELYGYYFNDVELQRVGGGDVDSFGIGADILAFPFRNVVPVFAILGGGFGEYDFDGTNTILNQEDAAFYDLGAGVLLPITGNGLSLRAEYRYRHADVETPTGGELQSRDNIVSLGLQIPLGRRAGAPQTEAFPWPAEKRPTPAAKPISKPAPAPVRRTIPVVPAPHNDDIDNDGVINRWDRCPNTPESATVDLNGCPAAAEAPLFVLEGVNFAYDSARLTFEAHDTLSEVADALHAAPRLRIRIEGHTDNIGGNQYNLRLAQQRANSVADYFRRQGISSSRMTAVSYGEARPIAPNNTPEDRAQNRRVEIHADRR